MADPSTSTLLPVIVGGLIAMAGGIVGTAATVIITLRQSSIDKQKRRADKFEELVTAVYAYDHWLDTKQDALVYDKDVLVGPSPLATVEALIAIYFPLFSDHLVALRTTANVFVLWMGEAAMRRTAGDIKHVNDGMLKAYDPYITARDALIAALVEHVKGELSSAPSGRGGASAHDAESRGRP